MKNLNLNQIPTFNKLPARNGAPPESSWGIFEDEALGCLNFLTPGGVVEAASTPLHVEGGIASPPNAVVIK